MINISHQFYNIDFDKINLLSKNDYDLFWSSLSKNPHAMLLLEKNMDKVSWTGLSSNPNAIDLLEKNLQKINWHFLAQNHSPVALELFKKRNSLYSPNIIHDDIYRIGNWTDLSANPYAIKILRNNPNKINWSMLSLNPCAIKILEENLDKVSWDDLCNNPHPKAINLIKKVLHKEFNNEWYWQFLSANPHAIELLKDNYERINWKYLCRNPSNEAMRLISENINKIDWEQLSANPHPYAIKLLNESKEKIYWYHISSNSGAIEIIKENIEKINLPRLARNSNVCDILLKYNYKTIKEHFYGTYGKELIEWLFHPRNANKWGRNCWNLD